MNVNKNMSFSDYRDVPLLNKSHLSNFVYGNSPRQALYRKDSSGFSDGTAFHSVMEHGIDGNPELIVSPFDSFRTNEAKLWKTKQQTDGMHVVTQKLLDDLKEAREMTKQTIISQMGIDIDDGKGEHEVSVFSETEKIRLDYTRPEFHGDWKSCASAKPYNCYSDIEKYNYDLQSYMYSNVYEEVTGEYRPFVFIFQEIKPPFNCTIVEVSRVTMDAWAVAKSKYDGAKMRIKQCNSGDSYTDKLEMYQPAKFILDKFGVETNPFSEEK